jgi:hypothetical protein
MSSKRESIMKPQTFLPCLFCGVDSKPVLTFFIWLIGSAVLASFCIMLWGLFSGKFGSEETTSMIPINAEKEI